MDKVELKDETAILPNPCYMPQLGFSYYFQNVDNFVCEKCTNIKTVSIFV